MQGLFTLGSVQRYMICVTLFLHVVPVRKHTDMLELHVKLAKTGNKICYLGPLPSSHCKITSAELAIAFCQNLRNLNWFILTQLKQKPWRFDLKWVIPITGQNLKILFWAEQAVTPQGWSRGLYRSLYASLDWQERLELGSSLNSSTGHVELINCRVAATMCATNFVAAVK